MKDFLGKQIEVGDEIVGCVAHGRNSGASLSRGKVTRLTEKTVFFNGPNYAGLNERERKIDPSKVIVVNKLTKLSETVHKVYINESERGWGQRVDEIKFFDTYEEAQEFIKQYNSKNTQKQVPDWYMFADYGCEIKRSEIPEKYKK